MNGGLSKIRSVHTYVHTIGFYSCGVNCTFFTKFHYNCKYLYHKPSQKQPPVERFWSPIATRRYATPPRPPRSHLRPSLLELPKSDFKLNLPFWPQSAASITISFPRPYSCPHSNSTNPKHGIFQLENHDSSF